MSNVLSLHAVEPAISNQRVIVELDKTHIIAMWDSGIISNVAYVYLALLHDSQFDPPSVSRLNFDVFIERWRGPEDEKGKCKQLTPSSLAKAIASLYGKAADAPTHMNLDFFSVELGV